MKIILGLGNPGVEYSATRHNAGAALVDRLAGSKTGDLVLVKTKDVFMNESGRLLQGLPEGELYVAHDDLDVKLGEFKIQFGKGPKDHNGVESVERALGTKDFWRIRIGIDNRTTPVDGETYVLQKFTPEEKVILGNALDAIVKAVNTNQKSGR